VQIAPGDEGFDNSRGPALAVENVKAAGFKIGSDVDDAPDRGRLRMRPRSSRRDLRELAALFRIRGLEGAITWI
jgi:hypothetical protein